MNEEVTGMKLGIPLLVIGVLLLLFSIPYSIISIIVGLDQAQGGQGLVSFGFSPYVGLIAVIAGFVLTTVGAVRVFKH
jgi:hypothetical protein